MSVVVAVDGSAESRRAIRLAWQEAAYREAALIAVTAYRSERAAGTPPVIRPVAPARTADEERMLAESGLREAVREALGQDAARVELCVAAGAAGRAIVDTARQARAELIVLASRAGSSMLPGTASQHVLRHAHCPVLIAPPSQTG